MSAKKDKITVYYDGACPACVRDRQYYESLAGGEDGGVCWYDITGREEELQQLGIDPHKALTELHVSDEAGRVLSELDAYILLMRRVPRLKPLASLIGLPGVKPLLGAVYRWMVLRRLRKTGRL